MSCRSLMPLLSLLIGIELGLVSCVASEGTPAVEVTPSSEWTQWRGPSRDGTVAKVKWPDTISDENLKPLWKRSFGPSYSGPIVVGDLVFVTETKNKKSEIVHALDRATGEVKWSRDWLGAMSVPFFAKSNGDWIRSTPSYDDGKLYVAGMRDVLVCLDAANGDEIWRVDFAEKFKSKLPDFGLVCSPLVHGDHLYVQAGGGLCKLDKKTGEVVWRTLGDGGGMWGSAFSSPVVATLAGREQLLVQTRQDLAGVDLQTGELFWSQKIPAFRGMNIMTPVVFGDAVFTSSYGGKSLLFDIAAGGSGREKLKHTERWSNNSQGYMSTPIVYGGHAYMHLRNQRFTCLDLSTGEEKWRTRPFGKYWSMVANDNKILALDERGELLLINATPEKFDLVSKKTITEEPTWAHLAVAGDEVFVRGLKTTYAFKWKSDKK